MKTEKLELFANNEVIYKTLIDGPTSRKELADVVSEVYGKKKTASYDIIKELLNDENGMLSVEGDVLSLNQDEFDEFMDELLSSYASKSISEKMTRIKDLEGKLMELEKKYVKALESQQVIAKDAVEIEDPTIEPFDTFMITRCGFLTARIHRDMLIKGKWFLGG